jgi:hypothetical protein
MQPVWVGKRIGGDGFVDGGLVGREVVASKKMPEIIGSVRVTSFKPCELDGPSQSIELPSNP